jgi:hypothetical protein
MNAKETIHRQITSNQNHKTDRTFKRKTYKHACNKKRRIQWDKEEIAQKEKDKITGKLKESAFIRMEYENRNPA